MKKQKIKTYQQPKTCQTTCFECLPMFIIPVIHHLCICIIVSKNNKKSSIVKETYLGLEQHMLLFRPHSNVWPWQSGRGQEGKETLYRLWQ